MGATVTIVALPATLEFPPREVSAPDPDGSAVPRYTAGGLCQTVRIGAWTLTPNAVLAGRLYLLDSDGNPLAVLPVSFTAGASADWGTEFTGTANADAAWPLGGAKAVAFKVDSLTSGSVWTITGALG